MLLLFWGSAFEYDEDATGINTTYYFSVNPGVSTNHPQIVQESRINYTTSEQGTRVVYSKNPIGRVIP